MVKFTQSVFPPFLNVWRLQTRRSTSLRPNGTYRTRLHKKSSRILITTQHRSWILLTSSCENLTKNQEKVAKNLQICFSSIVERMETTNAPEHFPGAQRNLSHASAQEIDTTSHHGPAPFLYSANLQLRKHLEKARKSCQKSPNLFFLHY